jgi:hypothetical protein
VFRRLRYGIELRRAGRRHGHILPAERTWVHPSELPGSFEHVVLPPPRPIVARRFQLLVASAASMLLATGGVLLGISATAPAGATVGPHIATTLAGLPSADQAAARTMLSIVIYEGEHVGTATAMVLPPGNLAVTTTPIPAHASVESWSMGHGWMSLQIVGSDRPLGVTVLRFPQSRAMHSTPIAPLQPAVATGGGPTTLTSLAAIPGATSPVEFEYAPTFLSAVETPVAIGRSHVVSTTGRSLAGVISGTVVLDAQGRAVAASVPTLGPSSFVSATFLQLLSQRIVLGDAGDHGWLQVTGADTPSGVALIASVARHGNAFRKLFAGDQILAINSVPVRTMFDVDSILYTTSPREPVLLTVLHDNVERAVTVVLSASP